MSNSSARYEAGLANPPHFSRSSQDVVCLSQRALPNHLIRVNNYRIWLPVEAHLADHLCFAELFGLFLSSCSPTSWFMFSRVLNHALQTTPLPEVAKLFGLSFFLRVAKLFRPISVCQQALQQRPVTYISRVFPPSNLRCLPWSTLSQHTSIDNPILLDIDLVYDTMMNEFEITEWKTLRGSCSLIFSSSQCFSLSPGQRLNSSHIKCFVDWAGWKGREDASLLVPYPSYLLPFAHARSNFPSSRDPGSVCLSTVFTNTAKSA
ncbi:hypothetical protein GGR50DRAFT_540966 [Xylaria sp. CBS 124048]|nr:hypothetical protein GGR50DRAFT_540966 [Xylaria sp. CBS 124048]